MLTTLKEYIESIQTKHEVRVKFACEVTDEMMDKIERHLQKYDATKVSSPSKTIMQARPLDFPNIDMAEIYIVDFTSNLPVSNGILHQELCGLLSVSSGLVVVRNAADAREEEKEEPKEEYVAKLGTDYNKKEGSDVKSSDMFGDKYNAGLLKELKKISDEKKKSSKVTKEKTPKDPDVLASEPELGDGKETNKKSAVANRGPLVIKK